eukprot:1158389-Pelagomonas_calceolata.AAC.3
MDTVVPPVAEQYGINVLGVALTGHTLPLHMLNLMRNYRGAVLVRQMGVGLIRQMSAVESWLKACIPAAVMVHSARFARIAFCTHCGVRASQCSFSTETKKLACVASHIKQGAVMLSRQFSCVLVFGVHVARVLVEVCVWRACGLCAC